MTFSRVRYRERQVLTAADLADEQAYRLAMGRRHNIAHHAWGIVQGLALALEPSSNDLTVQPGMAIDGYGRELLVPVPLIVPKASLDEIFKAEAPLAALAVWLLYDRQPFTPAQQGHWDCGAERHSRWIEGPRLCLTAAAAGPNDPDPRRPLGVSTADLDFEPQRSPPDEPEKQWPVYLGKLFQGTSNSSFAVDLSRRPYAGLLGWLVRDPAGRAVMQVGNELSSDPRRFAVSVLDGNGVLRERLVTDDSGHTSIWGDLIVKRSNQTSGNDGNTQEDKSNASESTGSITTQGVNFEPLAEVPKVAMPWKIYMADVLQKDQPRINQLRFEIFHPGKEGDPSQQRLIVGVLDENGTNKAFRPCLTVSADCQVTVHGALEVDGEIVEGPIQADLDDPRFGSALLGGWLEGELEGAATLGAAYSGTLTVDITAPNTASPGDPIEYKITLTNPGLAPVSEVMVIENLAYKGAIVRQKIITQHRIVNPGEPITITVDGYIVSDAGDQLIISLTAAGLVADLIPVFTTASVEVDIYEPPVGKGAQS